jgi:hypothetical protein
MTSVRDSRGRQRRTNAQAFFSVPFCASLAWLRGAVTFEELHRFDDAAILALVGRIQGIADPSCERYKPLVRVTLKSGSSFEWCDESVEKGYDLDWSAAVNMTQQLCAEAGRDQHTAMRSSMSPRGPTRSTRPESWLRQPPVSPLRRANKIPRTWQPAPSRAESKQYDRARRTRFLPYAPGIGLPGHALFLRRTLSE